MPDIYETYRDGTYIYVVRECHSDTECAVVECWVKLREGQEQHPDEVDDCPEPGYRLMQDIHMPAAFARMVAKAIGRMRLETNE